MRAHAASAGLSSGTPLCASLRSRAASPKDALPVVTFAESVTFHLNGETIAVTHVAPAHTDGDSIVHFKDANAIHAGDLFFNGLYPFIDVSSGGGINGVIAAKPTAEFDEKWGQGFMRPDVFVSIVHDSLKPKEE